MSNRKTFSGSVVAALCLVLLVSAASVPVMGQTLSLLHCWGGERAPMVEKMLSEFAAAHPGITVNNELVGCGAALAERLKVLIAAGIPPDVAMVHTTEMAGLADIGNLVSLDNLMERDGLPASMWYPSELGASQWRGSTYGLPIRTGGDANSLIFYNRDLFGEAGLEDQSPRTWDELEDFSRKLIRYEGDHLMVNPIANIAGYTGDAGELAWLYSGGGRFLSEDGRRVTFADPAGVDMLEWVYNFRSSVYRAIGDDGEFGNDFVRAQFAEGRAGMFITGVWNFTFVHGVNPDFNLGAGVRPRQQGSSFAGANAGTFLYAIPSGSEHQAAAWELLKWLTVDENGGGWFMLAQGRPSPIIAFNQNPVYYEENPLFSVVGEALASSALVEILPIHSELVAPFNQAFRQGATGALPPREALEDAMRLAQATLDRYLSEQ